MPGNGKVFISHAHEDNDRCAPLLAALDAWGVDYWFDTLQMHAGQDLSDRIQKSIADATIFIRVCTPAAQASFWVGKETGAFFGLQALDHKAGQSGRRTLIPLRLDAGYSWQPFELDTVYIDATGKPQRDWLDELRRALGFAIPSPSTDRDDSRPLHTAAPAPAPTIEPSASHPATSAREASTSPAAQTSGSRTWLVDVTGHGDHKTIEAALQAATAGDRILVSPGTYNEICRINEAIEIVGHGKRDDIILEARASQSATVIVRAKSVSIQGLTIRGNGAGMDAMMVVTGGTLHIEDCDITAANGDSGIYVSGGSAVIQRCRIHNCKRNGVVLAGSSSEAVLEGNEITHCQMAAIHVKPGAQITARRNQITVNESAAIQLSIPFFGDARPSGSIEDNILRPNKGGAWNIETGAATHIKRERNLE